MKSQKILSLLETKHFKTLKKKQTLYHQGDVPEGVYFIENGVMGLFHISEEGHETLFRVFGRGSVLGHRAYFANEPYHADAIALSEVSLVHVSPQECDRLCKEHPDLMKDMIAHLAMELKNAELRLAGLQDFTAPQRIVQAIVYLKLNHPTQRWTRKEIAEYAGTTNESVTRVMSDLEKQGLLIKEGRDFSLPDPQALLD